MLAVLRGQFFQPMVEIAAGKSPLEGLGDLFIMPFKLGQALRHHRQRGKIIGGEHLLLQDGKVNLDLIEPTGMHRPMHQALNWHSGFAGAGPLSGRDGRSRCPQSKTPGGPIYTEIVPSPVRPTDQKGQSRSWLHNGQILWRDAHPKPPDRPKLPGARIHAPPSWRNGAGVVGSHECGLELGCWSFRRPRAQIHPRAAVGPARIPHTGPRDGRLWRQNPDRAGTPPRLHVDAVQAFGKVRFDPASAGAGSAAFSAHKLGGPRGIGALWVAASLETLSVGGGQEGSLRPGTENLQGAWAFAAAAAYARDSFARRVDHARELETRLISGLSSIPGVLALPLGRVPSDERYSPYILSAAFPGLSGEVLVRSLSDSGIAVSTGSACSSNSKRAGRRVMRAMGLPEDIALSSIRVSSGESTTEADIDSFLEAASLAYRRLKA